MIIVRAPYRISLFGGGSDIPEYFSNFGGSVISTTINKYCYISIKNLLNFYEHKYLISWSRIERCNSISDIEHPTTRNILDYFNISDGIEIHHTGDLPARSGVGSSSAFAVAMSYIMLKKIYNFSEINKRETALLAYTIERFKNNEFVGLQDQVAASYGGLNHIEFFGTIKQPDFSVNKMNITSEYEMALQGMMVLLFIGLARNASEIEEKKFENSDAAFKKLHVVREICNEALGVMRSQGEILELGKLLHESWNVKKSLSENVSNSKINQCYDRAMELGAVGGKILGAGGGGFMLFIVPPNKRKSFIEGMNLLNVDFEMEKQGVQIVSFSE
jgi:D-glycero-alpha-D-manno-heptose-7-phosphate kinase